MTQNSFNPSGNEYRFIFFFLSAFISPHTVGYKIMLQNKTYIARWY